jgi:hypothetical protein
VGIFVMPKSKQEVNRNRHRFLNEYFFPNTESYSLKHWKDWVLERRYNPTTGEHEVAIYKVEDWNKAQEYYYMKLPLSEAHAKGA